MASQKIYDRTKRFAATFMVVASNVIPVLQFVPGYTAAPRSNINGPYKAGTLNGLGVYVSPAVDPGTVIWGVNGSDLYTSWGVYAPYMAIVPTMLIQMADGTTSQGWSTLYDMKVLNADLVIAGRITA